MPGNFIDTNVLVYLASDDQAKADRAEEILAAGGDISIQVLNELANVARRKMGLTWADLQNFLDPIRELLSVHSLTEDTHRTGLALAERYRLSVYDSMIVASALEAGCQILLSEDMQNGLVIESNVRIVNPFS